MHLFFIVVIIMLGVVAYMTWFGDLAKRNYEAGFIIGPKSLRAYTIVLKVMTLFLFLGFLAWYILYIIGVL